MLTGTTINKVVSWFRTTYSLIQHDVASQRNGQETRVGGDVAYSGQCDVIRQHAPNAKSFVQAKAHRHRPRSEEERARNRTKSKIRAKIEQAFLVIKWILGWAKVRYRRLAKNIHWLQISREMVNLYVAHRRLLVEV